MSDAIDFVNSMNKPLALYLFTNDKNLKAQFSNETSAGTLVINDAVVQVSLHYHCLITLKTDLLHAK